MRHTVKILQRNVNPDTGVIEVVYEFDGQIDSKVFANQQALVDAKDDDPLQTGVQALQMLVAFWQAQGGGVILNREVQIDFAAVAPNPQVSFTP